MKSVADSLLYIRMFLLALFVLPIVFVMATWEYFFPDPSLRPDHARRYK